MDRDLTNDLDPVKTLLLFRDISVRKNTLDMYAELSPRIPNAVRKNLADVTCKFMKCEINLFTIDILLLLLIIITPKDQNYFFETDTKINFGLYLNANETD